MDWGNAASELLSGGGGSDTYRIALNQGQDVIADAGGADTLALYVGTQFSLINTAWFSRDGDDLLVRIPDGFGGWLLDVRIESVSANGGIERIELYSGSAYRLTDSIDLVAQWTALGGALHTFDDDFDRADGAVGNGWQDVADNPGGDLVVDDQVVTIAGVNSPAGIFRSIDDDAIDTASFTLTQHGGVGLSNRFSYLAYFGSDGQSDDLGYGISINRGDQNYSDSRVQLVLDGVILDQAFAPFQFVDELRITFSVLADGTVRGTVSEGANSFDFDFGPATVSLTGDSFAIFMEAPNTGPGNYIYPTLDDLILFASTPEQHEAGTAAADTLFGDAANDGLSGAGGDDDLSGLAGDDSLWGGAGADDLLGGAGNDTLYGGVGADTLDGGDGDDLLLDGGSDTDSFTGGNGADTVSYVEATAAVTVSLSLSGSQATGGAGSDSLTGIENLTGSGFNDTLTGDGGANRLDGWTGHDHLYGGAGDDTLLGLDGGDKLYAGDGADILEGGEGADSLYGEANADQLDGGAGNDTLEGGAGNDTVVGGDGSDAIKGGADNDLLYGGGGGDILQGHAGVDLLVGGAGADSLTGGGGLDSFVFGEGDLGTTAGATDLITDYKASDGDTIDLSGIDADAATAGDQAFTFVAGMTGVAGQATLTFSAGVTTAAFDTNGDAAADLYLLLAGNVTASALWIL